MDLPDNELDVWIEVSLQPGTSVTQQQKQFAWERLSEQVAYQAILPPVLTAQEKSYAMRVYEASGLLWRWFSSFAADEARYERARVNRNMMRYQCSSANGEMALQFLSPLRLSI